MAATLSPWSRAGQEEALAWAQRFFTKLYPEYLRVGPWHPVAKVCAAALAILLAASRRSAFAASRWPKGVLEEGPERRPTHIEQAESERMTGKPLLPRSKLRFLRLIGSGWGVSVLVHALRNVGPWPMLSYTVQSWTLMTTRYLVGLIVPIGPDAICTSDDGAWGAQRLRRAFNLWLIRIHEGLRFPSLVQNTVTVTVWWLALVPIVVTAMRKDERSLRQFLKFNRSFSLINFHGLNLPLAVADHLLCPRRLGLADLWLGVSCAAMYAAFYYTCLDPRGIHLYIFLSPRTKLSSIALASMLSFYGGLYLFWDAAARETLRLSGEKEDPRSKPEGD